MQTWSIQYLTSHNYDFAYDRSHNVRPKRNIRQAMQHEVTMYAICQKEGEFSLHPRPDSHSFRQATRSRCLTSFGRLSRFQATD